MRTYDLKPGTVPEYQRRFADKLAGRLDYSPLGGHWYTDIGPLNQVVAVWPYEDLDHRARIRHEAEASCVWPPDTDNLIISMRSDILKPTSFMTPLANRKIGPLYEMRIYTYPPEEIPIVLKLWSERIGAREQFSPLAGCWYKESGGLDNFIHVWAYKSLDQRSSIRKGALEKGIWPPTGLNKPIRQKNKILLPASSSPMQ